MITTIKRSLTLISHICKNIYRHIWRAGPVWDVTGPNEPGAQEDAVSGYCRQIFSFGAPWHGSELWSLCARCRSASSKGHQSGGNREIIEIHWALLSADRTVRTCPRDAEERRPQVCPGCVLPHVKVIRWHQLNRQLIESLCHVHLWLAREGNPR